MTDRPYSLTGYRRFAQTSLPMVERCRSVKDEGEVLETFILRTAADGDCSEMNLEQFAGQSNQSGSLNLSTLHSAKGREFKYVVMFGMDNGRIPRVDATEEARRLFYVGFTRAKSEVHIVFTKTRPSPFVLEVQERLRENSPTSMNTSSTEVD